MMILPLTLPLAAHLDRRIALSKRPGWSPERSGATPPARVLEIEILSDQEEAALRSLFPGLTFGGGL